MNYYQDKNKPMGLCRVARSLGAAAKARTRVGR
jgi:hypothetical protein